MSSDDFDEDREEQYRMEAAADGAYEDFINETRKLQSEEAVQRYLQTYGDTIESRVQQTPHQIAITNAGFWVAICKLVVARE